MAAYSFSKQPIIKISKSNLYGLLGTILSCVLLFLIMWFYVMPYTSIPQQVEEEGLMISFGDSEDAGGSGTDDLASSDKEAMAATATTPEAPVKATPVNATLVKTTAVKISPTKVTAAPIQEQLVTQNNAEDEISVVKPTQKVQKDQKDQKLEDIKNQQLEDLRKQQLVEKLENEKKQAQRKLEEQRASNKANSVVDGLFGGRATTPGGTSSSQGNGTGGSQGSGTNGTQSSGNGTSKGVGNGPSSGVKGNPAGRGNLGGNSFSLDRGLVGSLIPPSYNNDVEGTITANIRVDETGKVVSASIGSPTTISDSETRNAALYAARRTRFTNGSGFSNGTITYYFRLK